MALDLGLHYIAVALIDRAAVRPADADVSRAKESLLRSTLSRVWERFGRRSVCTPFELDCV